MLLLGQVATKLVDRDRRICNINTERPAHRGGDSVIVHFDRTEELIGLARVRCRIGEDMPDEPALILRSDRRMASSPERDRDALLLR